MNWLRPRQLTLPAPLPNQSGNLTVETDSLWAGVLQLYACHGQPLSWTFYPSPRGCNYKNDGRDQTQPLRIISPLGLCCLAAPALLDSTHQPLPAYNHIHSHSSAHLLLQLGKRGGGENQKKAASFCNLLVDLLLGGRSSMEDLLGLLRINIKRGYNLAVRDVYSSDPYVFVRMGKQVRPIIPRKPFWSFASNSSVSLSLSLSFISILSPIGWLWLTVYPGNCDAEAEDPGGEEESEPRVEREPDSLRHWSQSPDQARKCPNLSSSVLSISDSELICSYITEESCDFSVWNVMRSGAKDTFSSYASIYVQKKKKKGFPDLPDHVRIYFGGRNRIRKFWNTTKSLRCSSWWSRRF